MRVLVTGGAGYIGGHVVRALADRGDEVLVYDLAAPPPGPLREVPSVVADVRDGDALRRALGEHRAEAVVHLAGLKSVSASLVDPAAYFDTNVRGSLVVCQAMLAAGVRHLVFSGSCAVYGTPDRLPVDESAAIRPENPYGESKALVERMLAWLSATGGLEYVSLRYFNAAGAAWDALTGEDWSEAVNLIPVVMKAALGLRPPVEVFGTDFPTPDGSAVRDYIHVVDLANAHLCALDHLVSGGRSEVLNVGTGRGSSVLEVIGAVERVSGRPVPMQAVPRRAGDPAAIWADSSRAAAVLGWRARHGLGEIVETAWRWHAGDGDRARLTAAKR